MKQGLIHDGDIERWKAMEAAAKGVGSIEHLDVPLSRQLLAVPFTGKDVPVTAARLGTRELRIWRRCRCR